MAKGKVIFWESNKNFGRIEPDDAKGTKIYFNRASMSTADLKKVGQDSEVEFELADPEPPQGPKAERVKILTEGKKEKPAQTGFTATFVYGELVRNEQLFELPVFVFVTTLDSKPVSIAQAEVVLKCQNGDVLEPTRVQHTRANGSAQFLIRYSTNEFPNPELIERLSLATTVKVGDKESTFAELWPPQEVEPPKPPEPDKGTAKDVVRLKSSASSPFNADGFKAVIPLEALNDKGKGAAIQLTAKVTKGNSVTFYDASNSSVLSDGVKSVDFTTGPDGKFHLGINFNAQFEIEVAISYPEGKTVLKFAIYYN